MNVVKMGAQLDSPNQISEMTIQTKTDVEFSTASTSCTTPRSGRERKAPSPISTDTITAAPKPTTIRISDAAVCFHTSPVWTISTAPATTDRGDGSTYAPYRHDRTDHTSSTTPPTTSVGTCSLVIQ